jgi:hypothetical protein
MAKFDHCECCGKYDLVRRTIVENIVKLICLNCVYTPNDRAPPRPQVDDASPLVGRDNPETAAG